MDSSKDNLVIMTDLQIVKQQREDIQIEELLWDVLKKYPKVTVSRVIYILAGMVKYLAAQEK